MVKRTETKIEQDIIDTYRSGLSMHKTGTIYGVSAATVMHILNRHHIQPRTKGGIVRLDEDRICSEYMSGISTRKLAKEFGVTAATVCSVLERHCISRDKNEHRYRNVEIDVTYFDNIYRADKAYFLGYLVTDGNVGLKSNAIKLDIHEKDIKCLELFNAATGSTNRIKKRKGRPHVSITVKCKRWKDALARYGVVPRKTHKAYMPMLSSEMMPHLIRGMIDGDGWITKCPSSGGRIGFCGSTCAVTNLRDYLVGTLGVRKVKVIQTKEHLWSVSWGSKRDFVTIGNYIYRDKGEFYLQRKYDKFLSAIGNTEVSTQTA